MAENASLMVRIGANLEDLDKALGRMGSKFDALGANLRSAGGTMTKYVTAPLTALAGVSLKVSGDMEQAEVAFRVMLGSAEKATEVVQGLYEFAAKTPFDFEGIQNAARLLLNAKVSTEDLQDVLGRLGDIAAGSGQRIEDLALIYQQVANKGKLQNEELLQFAERGVPIYDALAQALGKSTAEIQAMSSKGQLGINDLNKAFELLTNEGGRFYKMSEEQSKTLVGKWETFKDSFVTLFDAIGDALQDAFDVKGLMDVATEKIEALAAGIRDFTKEHPVLTKLFAAFAGFAVLLGPILGSIGGLVGAVGALKVGFTALGISMKAALVTSGIGALLVGLGTVAYLVWDNWEEVSGFLQGLWARWKLMVANLADYWLGALGSVVGIFSDDMAAGIEKMRSGLADMKAEAEGTLVALDQKKAFKESQAAADDYLSFLDSQYPATTQTVTNSTNTIAGANEAISKTLEDLAASLAEIDAKQTVLGSSFNAGAERVEALQSAMMKLVQEGIGPGTEAYEDLRVQLAEASAASKAWEDRVLEGVEKVTVAWPKVASVTDDTKNKVLPAVRGMSDETEAGMEQIASDLEKPISPLEKLKSAFIANLSGTVFEPIYDGFVHIRDLIAGDGSKYDSIAGAFNAATAAVQAFKASSGDVAQMFNDMVEGALMAFGEKGQVASAVLGFLDEIGLGLDDIGKKLQDLLGIGGGGSNSNKDLARARNMIASLRSRGMGDEDIIGTLTKQFPDLTEADIRGLVTGNQSAWIQFRDWAGQWDDNEREKRDVVASVTNWWKNGYSADAIRGIATNSAELADEVRHHGADRVAKWVDEILGKLMALGIGPDDVGALAVGGIVTRPTLSWVGEGGVPEAVIPLPKLPQMMRSIMETSSMRSSSPMTINMYLDGRLIGQTALEYMQPVANLYGVTF